MVLWIAFAVLAAAVVWAVTRPLLASGSDAPKAADSELAVYRDQLDEIESARAQGHIAGSDAEGARIEVARRLLQRAQETSRLDATARGETSRARQAALCVAAALPVVGIAVYLALGSPALPGRPYAERLEVPLEQASAADLVAKVEAHLRQHPEDGRGWDVLGPVYLRTGDFQQAADAYERAIRLLGDEPKRLAGFARATIMVQNGVVSEPARQAYAKLRAQDPQAIEPQVWLAIAKEQDGDLAGAASEYRTLLAGGGSQEPWKGLLDERLRSVTQRLAGAEANPAAPNIEPADAMGPAAAMSPQDREKFIGQMVDGLAARLKKDGNDLDGWMRLVRSYAVLGRKQEATTALTDARRQFAGDEKSLAELHALAESLGLGS